MRLPASFGLHRQNPGFHLSLLLSLILFACSALTSTAAAAPGKTIVATDAGIVGDGSTLNSAAIQKAINQCNAAGGGTIEFPAGRYVTGTIQLKDSVVLRIDKDAVLLGSTNSADYRNLDPFTAGDGVPLGYALIIADGAKNIGIEGEGTIDGRGRELRAAQKPYTVRPFLMRWLRCTNVSVKTVHLTNPGAWTLNFFQSRDIHVEGVTIRTRNTGLANNDGIDLDSCDGARVIGCDIDSGDDALCVKATSPFPSRNITITGCKLSTRCNAFKLGTESLGDFEKIELTQCEIRNTGMAGIALYSVDGANLQNVAVSDVTMNGVAVPVSVRLGARSKTFRAGQTAKPSGQLHDITIKNIRATGTGMIGLLVNGIPNHPVENITFSNIQIELPGGGTAEDAKRELPEREADYPEFSMFGRKLPACALYLRHIRGVTFQDVKMTLAKPDARPAAKLIDVQAVNPADFLNSFSVKLQE